MEDLLQTTYGVPYKSYDEYLLDELQKLDIILKSMLMSASGKDESNVSNGLFVQKSDIMRLFEEKRSSGRQTDLFDFKDVNEKAQEIESRLAKTNDAFETFPAERLKNLFSLNPIEYQILIMALAPVIDSKYEKIFAYLQDSVSLKYPTIQLVANLYAQNLEDISSLNRIFSANHTLLYWNLIQFLSDAPFGGPSRSFGIDSRIADYLLNDRRVDLSLAGSICFYSRMKEDSNKEPSVEALANYIKSEPEETPFILCTGESLKVKLEAASDIARSVNTPLLYVRVNQEVHSSNVNRIIREANLFQSLLFLDFSECAENQSYEQIRVYSEVCENLIWPVFFSLKNKFPKKTGRYERFFELHFNIPSRAERNKLWKSCLNSEMPVNGDSIDHIVDQFQFSEEQIENAVTVARRNSIINNRKKITAADILVGCRSQSDHNLSQMGVKLNFNFNKDDIVLPKDKIDHLTEIVDQYKNRVRVLETWGFHNKVAYGKGLTVLFSGPSGTGKTMAASVIARELKLDIYKIDLSSVVSKYIGETEKNLAAIFNEASLSNAILFFDEADALFGKRTEVKDSHDRYANIETSFLLQKMEEYEGITVLASNIRQNMDNAFLRRINFIVEFPFPDKILRETLWKKMFPEKAPLGNDIDYGFLAEKFELAGGNIKNITLSAAYMASASESEINMEHLIRASKREFEKMGKPFIVSEYLPYSKFLDKKAAGVN